MRRPRSSGVEHNGGVVTRSEGLLFYGDPHGEWRPLLRACAEAAPGAVVILGDCDLEKPLSQQIAPIFRAGIPVYWIPGNHDVDREEWHDRLWGDHPEGNLHANTVTVSGIAVAGLGGIFKERVWYPRYQEAPPLFDDRGSYLKQIRSAERWRGSLPLSVRAVIFPDDIAALGGTHADVLVTHEAPSCHRHGFVGIDRAARACRSKLIIHGHHHEGYDSHLPDGIWVKGIGKAEVFRLTRDMLA